MPENIYTIPIREAFERREGCPLCRLERDLETASLEFVSGPALMEPDLRLETNRLGFCRAHTDRLLGMKNRLGLALLLETRLAEIDRLLAAPGQSGKKRKKKNAADGKNLSEAAESCFICRRVRTFGGKYVDNTAHLWKTDPGFRALFAEQPYFCLGHAGRLLESAAGELSPALFGDFCETLLGLARAHAEDLRKNLGAFIRSFDYRFAGEALDEGARRAVEDAGDFLSGEEH